MKFFFPVENARTLKNPFEDSGSHVEKRTFSYVEIQNIPKEFRNFIQQDFFDPHMKEKAMSILQEHPQEFHLFITPILIHADIARFDNRKNKILVALDEKNPTQGIILGAETLEAILECRDSIFVKVFVELEFLNELDRYAVKRLIESRTI